MAAVTPLRMPKWGLSMQEGRIVSWWKAEGSEITEGEDLVDIETSKITNVYAAPASGILRRIVAQADETLPVGALIGVLADAATDDAQIDAFVADFQARFTPGEDAGEAAGALTLERIEVDGRTLQVGRAGTESGVPVVLLHGFSGDMNNWLFNLDALAAVAPVVAFDLPGHGGSAKDVGDGSLGALAATIARALDVMGIARAHFIGHSLGAAVAARLVADAPNRAASLTLICPALLPGTRLNEEFLTGIVEARRARDVKPYLEMLFADPDLVSKDMIEDMMRFKRLDDVEDALGALRDQLVSGNDAQALVADLPRIPAATVIASRQDAIVGTPDPASLPEGFVVRWIEGAGHMPHLERSADVNAILLEQIG
ncbi:MAG: acetoin dehydrogenase dihydrolipoyllysine-residue acetyltransferase subunit [Alphaproteobacteria bacterium]|nr:acetoin dehydrogenase dihydrolipoyllysine-residue acetyltransferase subunit [Alphaproteobacteria bacterium]